MAFLCCDTRLFSEMELRQGTMRFAGGELRVVDGGDGSGGHVVAVRPEDDIGDFDGGRDERRCVGSRRMWGEILPWLFRQMRFIMLFVYSRVASVFLCVCVRVCVSKRVHGLPTLVIRTCPLLSLGRRVRSRGTLLDVYDRYLQRSTPNQPLTDHCSSGGLILYTPYMYISSRILYEESSTPSAIFIEYASFA